MEMTKEVAMIGHPVPGAVEGAVDIPLGGTADLTPVGRGERGMVSAEWAVGIIAAIGIAGVLLAVVTSGGVKDAILNFILLVIRAFARGL